MTKERGGNLGREDTRRRDAEEAESNGNTNASSHSKLAFAAGDGGAYAVSLHVQWFYQQKKPCGSRLEWEKMR